MIARISIVSYDTRDALVKAASTPEGLAVLTEIFGSTLPEPSNIGLSYMWPAETLIDMDTDGPRLAALGIQFTVISFKGTLPLTAILPNGGGPVTVYVQVPHIGLLAVNEVEVEEDCCTDRLQRKLDEGWRILCVCPPNAARRPDYILGRTKERS